MATTPHMSDLDDRARRANRRLAIVLGIVAVGFYLLMLFFNHR